jgi:hypothetical protein
LTRKEQTAAHVSLANGTTSMHALSLNTGRNLLQSGGVAHGLQAASDVYTRRKEEEVCPSTTQHTHFHHLNIKQ